MKWIFAAGLCLFTAQASATPLTFLNDFNSRRMYFAAGAGDMLYDASGTNSVSSGSGGWPNDRYNFINIANQAYGFLEAGYTWQRQALWAPSVSVGARYMYVPSASITGNIDQYSLPAFNNYTYSYDVDMLSLLGVLKVNIYQWQKWLPYVSVGAGVTTYGTFDYIERARSGVTPRVSPAFGDGSGNNFTYLFGLGVDYTLSTKLKINLEGDYINYGTIQTGKGANYSTLTGTNYDNELLANDINATTLFLGITYYME